MPLCNQLARKRNIIVDSQNGIKYHGELNYLLLATVCILLHRVFNMNIPEEQ